MQSVHESFTNTNLTNLTNWLAQTGFYELRISRISRIGLRRQAFTHYEFHEFHESHELIIMTTNLTNWLVAQGRIMGTGFWISGDRLFFENNLSPEIQKPVPVILVPVILQK